MTALHWSPAALIDLQLDQDGGWRVRAEAMELDLRRWHQDGMVTDAAIMVNRVAEDAALILGWSEHHPVFTAATANAVRSVWRHLSGVHTRLVAANGRKKVRR